MKKLIQFRPVFNLLLLGCANFTVDMQPFHLPNVCHIHYVPITLIIARTAREFGIRHNVTSLPGMIRSHFRFLKAMGSAEERWPKACPVVVRGTAALAS